MEVRSNHRRERSASSQQRACVECRNRKTRCIASRDASSVCSYCSKAGKRCTFEAPQMRTSLTRKNLDASELRCRRLESIIRSLRPDIDIEAAILGTSDEGIFAELDDRSSDEFEWNEMSLTENSITSKDRDGMANIPAKSHEAGYLGSTSGSQLLQAISSLIPDDTICSSSSRPSQLRDHGPSKCSPLNLGLNEQVATSAIADELINVYFRTYHPSYPILHEHTFKEKCQNRASRSPKTSFQITFYMVLAIGHWLSSSEKEHAQAPYYSAARSLFTVQLLEAGTLETVQALLLMGNYLQKMDRPNTGYNLIGIAYRMALGLGLHREAPTKRNTDILGLERRRQVFWVLYSFDSGFSITTGRPTTISDTFIDARLPRNIETSDLGMTSIPIEVAYPTPYSAIIAQSKLATIANRMHTSLMCIQNTNVGAEPNSAAIEQLIDEWKLELPLYFTAESVPGWFKAPRAVLLWKEQNLRILLWQATERHPNFWMKKIESRSRCSRAAMQTINDITSFYHSHAEVIHPGINWYSVYFVFQAVIVLLLYELQSAQPLLDTTEQDATSWGRGIAEARRFLSRLETDSNAATRCLAVLDRIQSSGSFPSPQISTGIKFGENMADAPQYYEARQVYNSSSVPGMPLNDAESPETAAILGEFWSTAADPSLSLFLGNNANHGFFQEFNGFPGTIENNYFDYINYNMYNTGS